MVEQIALMDIKRRILAIVGNKIMKLRDLGGVGRLKRICWKSFGGKLKFILRTATRTRRVIRLFYPKNYFPV